MPGGDAQRVRARRRTCRQAGKGGEGHVGDHGGSGVFVSERLANELSLDFISVARQEGEKKKKWGGRTKKAV